MSRNADYTRMTNTKMTNCLISSAWLIYNSKSEQLKSNTYSVILWFN